MELSDKQKKDIADYSRINCIGSEKVLKAVESGLETLEGHGFDQELLDAYVHAMTNGIYVFARKDYAVPRNLDELVSNTIQDVANYLAENPENDNWLSLKGLIMKGTASELRELESRVFFWKCVNSYDN